MFMTPANFPLIFLAGLGTGVLGALLGTGGGVFLIPILVLGVGLPMHYAIATSILSVIATSSAVATANVERGTVNMRLGMSLEVATAIGAICGGISAGWLSAQALEFLFGLVLIPTAWFMWRGKEDEGGTPAPSDGSVPARDHGLGATYFDDTTHTQITYHVKRLWAGMTISFLAGNLSGALGVGGGIFKVPALNLLCGVPIKAAAATSNFMIGVTAAASAFLYYGRGEVRPALTAAVVLGVLTGSVLGSLWNRHFSGSFLRRLFAVLLLAVSIQMLLRAATTRGTATDSPTHRPAKSGDAR